MLLLFVGIAEVSTHWAYSVGTRMKPAWNSSRFIGIGTAVNSARFRRGLSAKLGVSPTDCEAVILGREGQTSGKTIESKN